MTNGPARAGFDLDLRHGQLREGALAEILSLRYGDRIEVKSDGRCRRTGRLFVEYEQKGRPSGIATTDAEWWAFEYYDDCWLVIPTIVLRRLARRALRAGLTALGGDDNLYRGALVPLDWLTSAMELAA